MMWQKYHYTSTKNKIYCKRLKYSLRASFLVLNLICDAVLTHSGVPESSDQRPPANPAPFCHPVHPSQPRMNHIVQKRSRVFHLLQSWVAESEHQSQSVDLSLVQRPEIVTDLQQIILTCTHTRTHAHTQTHADTM